MTDCAHGISSRCCTCVRACVCFLNPVFKISPAFGFMPVALGIVLCFCFVLTSTCLDSFHASHSLLSTKLPVQDSPLNLKRRWASGTWKWKQHPKSWKKKKSKQATAWTEVFKGTTFSTKGRTNMEPGLTEFEIGFQGMGLKIIIKKNYKL